MNPWGASPGMPGVLSTCQGCGRAAETRGVTFMQNIGLLVIRFPRTVNGSLCRFCVEKYFWRYTAVSALLGWWGVISFFTTLVAIPMNIVNYVRCLGLREPPDDVLSLADKRTRGAIGMGCGGVVGLTALFFVGVAALDALSSDSAGDGTNVIIGAVFVGVVFGLPALVAFGLGLRTFLKGRARA